MNVNKQHKNSMFCMLFGTPEVLKELYSAVEGFDVPKDSINNINTLTDVFFMNKINDISFTIDDRIVVLIEHQSTINDNMPVRFLMYIGRIYEKIIEEEKIYKSKLIKIPEPEFIVLYNGTAPYPDYKELKLSAAFKNTDGIKQTKRNTIPLELIVKVYNINYGKNPEIMRKSETLNNYSFLIKKILQYKKIKPLEKAVRDAIEYCIEKNILKKFLMEHSSEIINMLIGEWNMDVAMAVACEEAREDGWEEGIREGREKGRKDEKLIIARNLFTKGSTPEFIQEITGLDMKTIQELTIITSKDN